MDASERLKKVSSLLNRRIENSYPSRGEVESRLTNQEPLTIYWGIDPTGPDVHLGHTIPLLVMREIAELGHRVILLIGDFTARIGDPTGKSSARTALSAEEVQSNMATYLDQVKKIIPADLFSVQYNSEWLSALSFEEVLKLTGMVTVQQMIQRDMFQERIKNEKPIHISEFLYPLMQGYDSVALRADGEVGGSDQTFNMLMGRTLEQSLLGKDKMVLTTRLLVDPSGKKMGKSEGNLIAINDSPQEIRRKVLATVGDDMVKTVFELCTYKDQQWIDEQAKNPKEAREQLASELVRMYHGEAAVSEATKGIELENKGTILTTGIGLFASASELKRLVSEGAVELNHKQVDRWDIETKPGDEILFGKGKLIKVK